MIDLILAFDNEDSELGVFFSRCAEIVSDSMTHDWSCISIPSNSLNEIHLEIRVHQFKGNFIFASFTHGSDSSLLSSGKSFIKSSFPRNYLANSFSYCFACHSGKNLGPSLVKNGTLSFIGYSDQVTFVVGYIEVFASCAVDGLISFKNGATISESLSHKKQKYTDTIDYLYSIDFLAASVLMENRDCLVLHGNGGLSNADFIN